MNTPVPLPRSTATNAYDLLLDVIRVVEEEPRRLLMDIVSNKYSWCIPNDIELPPCGTVGCVAGWCAILTGQERRASAILAAGEALGASPNVDLHDDDIEDAEHTEISDDNFENSLDALFFEEFPDDDEDVAPGSPEYVAHVVARIRFFMAKWETRLRAQVVVPS